MPPPPTWFRHGEDLVTVAPKPWRRETYDSVARRHPHHSDADDQQALRLLESSPPYVCPQPDPDDPTHFVLLPDLEAVRCDQQDRELPYGCEHPDHPPGHPPSNCFLQINDHGNLTLFVHRRAARVLHPQALLARRTFPRWHEPDTTLELLPDYPFSPPPHVMLDPRATRHHRHHRRRALETLAARAPLCLDEDLLAERQPDPGEPLTAYHNEGLEYAIQCAARADDPRPITVCHHRANLSLDIDVATLPLATRRTPPPPDTTWWRQRLAGLPCILEAATAWTIAWACI